MMLNLDEANAEAEKCWGQFVSPPRDPRKAYVGGFAVGALWATREADVREGRLRDAILDAIKDIRQWLQLARYQREKLDQDLGWCPTQAGIEASEAILGKIGDVLATERPGA